MTIAAEIDFPCVNEEHHPPRQPVASPSSLKKIAAAGAALASATTGINTIKLR